MTTLQSDIKQELASPATRFAGNFIDNILAILIGYVVFFLLEGALAENTAALTGMFAAAFYFIFSDALPEGQSIGKRLLKIQVVNGKTKRPCTILEAFLRNITFPLGFLDWIFIFFGEHRRLGDFLASTLVVEKN